MDSWRHKTDMQGNVQGAAQALMRVAAAAALWWLLASGAIAQTRARPASEAPSYTLHGRITHVHDGDSFVLQAAGREERVRMASIDAPELAQPSRQRPGQPYARAARTALTALIANKTLTLACFETDAYGRHVCDVPLEDGKAPAATANQRMVAQGLAWANRQRAHFLRDPALDKLERTARAEKRGLWRDRHPVAPWVWRDRCWRRGQCRGLD